MSSIPNVRNAVRSVPEYFSSIHAGQFRDLGLELEAARQDTVDSVPVEFTELVHRLFQTPAASQRRVTAFIGCDEATDARSVCTKAARLLAFQTRMPTCILDANQRPLSSPRLHGLNEASSDMEEAIMRPEAVRDLPSNQTGNLWYLSAASPQNRALPLLRTACLGDLMSQIQSDFHYALITGPPILVETSSIQLCAAADATVLVLRSATQRIPALETMRLLRSMDIIVAGAVVNQARH